MVEKNDMHVYNTSIPLMLVSQSALSAFYVQLSFLQVSLQHEMG